MTDKELLELAAIACGELQGEWIGNQNYFDGVLSRWNPLEDDGDALRLVVKLKLPLTFLNRQTTKCTPTNKYGKELCVDCGCYWDSSHSVFFPFSEKYGDDPDAATRRAIVRAAAEIGRIKHIT